VEYSGWGKERTSDANGHRTNIMKNDFQQSTNFKLSSQTQGLSQNNCIFFLKFIISVRGGHVITDPWYQKT
jgi:hypothetical protein